MAAAPTYQQILAERRSIDDFIPENSQLKEFIDRALAEVKLYLRNKRGVDWSTVYDTTNDVYFSDTDGATNNEDQIIRAITLLTVALVYKEYSQRVNDSQWWELYLSYKAETETLLDVAKLDIDLDEDGVIDTGEERITGQTFLGR